MDSDDAYAPDLFSAGKAGKAGRAGRAGKVKLAETSSAWAGPLTAR